MIETSFAESLVTDGMTICLMDDLVLREAGLRQVTCIVRKRQLCLYGHVARLPVEDPAHRIFPCGDLRGWIESRVSLVGRIDQVRSSVGAYAGAARRRVHLATVLLRPPSGHRPGRRQVRHARILQKGLHLTQP